tara:strand:- start:412 stop:1065 length:654 start_codon:yes stop_codon:yes gene_type:complete
MSKLKLITLFFLCVIPFLATSQSRPTDNSSSETTNTDQAFYRVIVDYSLFRPLGWRLPNNSPRYELIATKIPTVGEAKALIKESRSNQTYYVSLGDQLQESKIDEISANRVGLVSEGKTIFLSISERSRFLSTSSEKRRQRGRNRESNTQTAEKKSEERDDNESRGGRRGRRRRGSFDSKRAQEMRSRWANASPEERQNMIQSFRQRGGRRGRGGNR